MKALSANELRIGNWYLSTKFQVPVICELGDFYEIYQRADGSTEYDVAEIFEPIPLTEEWLLKFGFEPVDRNRRLVKLRYKEYLEYENAEEVRKWDGDNYFTYSLDETREVDLKYVHQLQNLYFALTREELTVKDI